MSTEKNLQKSNEKNLTEKQEQFLVHLFGESKGKPREAMRLAGYSDNTSLSEVMDPLKEHITKHMEDQLLSLGPRAILTLVDVLDNPKDLGNKYKLATVKEILDRLGVSKESAQERNNQHIKVKNVIILPEKKEPSVIVDDIEYEVVVTNDGDNTD